jgi:hypothetical protein
MVQLRTSQVKIKPRVCPETILWTAGSWSFPAKLRLSAGSAIIVVQQNRGSLPDRAVRALFVVVFAPILQLGSGVVKGHEPMGVQAFGAEPTIERFDEGVVGRLAGPGEVERNAVGVPANVWRWSPTLPCPACVSCASSRRSSPGAAVRPCASRTTAPSSPLWRFCAGARRSCHMNWVSLGRTSSN